MDAATLVTADQTPIDRITEDPGDTIIDADRDARSTAELQRLMDLADRYAHRLVSAADTPLAVLLLVHGSDLAVVTLDGPEADVRTLPRLLARRRPSAAALVVMVEDALGGVDGDLVFVVGETSDGLRDERRFRVRACGRTRRLTRLPDHAAIESPRAIPRLFPPQTAPTA